MKACLVVLALVIGCSYPSAPPPPGGGTDNPPIVGTGNTGGSPPLDAGIDAGLDGGEPNGACDNTLDLVAIVRAGGGRDASHACSENDCADRIGVPGLYEECVNTCVEDRVAGLSSDCAACYGSLERCSLEALCRPYCVNNDTCNVECSNCLRDYGCSEEFEACRGLPGDECPASP